MADKRTRARQKRVGIFIYCSHELRQRIERARNFTNRTISGYVKHAIARQLDDDELLIDQAQARTEGEA